MRADRTMRAPTGSFFFVEISIDFFYRDDEFEILNPIGNSEFPIGPYYIYRNLMFSGRYLIFKSDFNDFPV